MLRNRWPFPSRKPFLTWEKISQKPIFNPVRRYLKIKDLDVFLDEIYDEHRWMMYQYGQNWYALHNHTSHILSIFKRLNLKTSMQILLPSFLRKNAAKVVKKKSLIFRSIASRYSDQYKTIVDYNSSLLTSAASGFSSSSSISCRIRIEDNVSQGKNV